MRVPVSTRMDVSTKKKSNRYVYIVLVCILILGLGLRLWYLSNVILAPDYSALQQDPEVQDYYARAVLSGDWSVPDGATDPEMRTTPFYRPPGYGYLLILLYALSRGSYLAPRVFNTFLGVLTILLLFILGRRLFGEIAGLAAAFLAAIYSVFIYWEGEVNDPAVFVFLVPALFYVLDHWSRSYKLRYMLLAGIIFGAYGLARPNILAFGPVVALWVGWIAWKKNQLKRVWSAWPVLFFSTVLMIIPTTIRNYRASGEFVPVSTYFGLNLLIGNHEESDGVTPWLPYLQELEGSGKWSARDYVNVVRGVAKETGNSTSTHSEVSKYFTQKALNFMWQHPTLTLQNMIRKAILLWTPIEITCNKVVHFELQHYLPLRFLPRFSLIAGMFFPGLLLWAYHCLRGIKKADHSDVLPLTILLLLFVAFYLFSFLPFFVNGRARVPVIPVLMLFGGYVIEHGVAYVRSRAWGRLVFLVAVTVCCWVFFSIEFIKVEPDKARWHYQRADSWIRRGALEKARLEARHVIEEKGAPYMHHRLGKYFAAAGLMDEAIDQYEAGLQRDPTYQDMLYLLGVALIETGNRALAEQLLNEAIALNPYDARALNALAELLMKQERYEQALDLLERAFHVAPQYGDVIDNISKAMKALKRVDEIIERYRALLQENPNQPFVHYILGRDLAETGRVEEAFKHFEEAVRLYPQLDGARYLWAQELSRMGRSDEAIQQHREALALNPDLKYTHVALGRELSRLGRGDEAIHHFEEAIRIDPSFQDARYLLGKELVKVGRVTEAREQFETAVALNPQDARAHLELGMFWAEQGELETALHHYEAALAVKPNFAYALDRIGRLLALMNRPEEAIARYEQAIAADPRNQDIYFLLGRELVAQGQKTEAEKRFREALELDPQDARAHHELGTLLEERGEKEAAMRHYQEALRAAPQFGYVLYKIGRLLAEQGKLEEAQQRFEQAINLDPDNQDLYYLMGRELIAQGKIEKGRFYLERALAMNPNDARAHNDLALIVGSKDPETAIAHFEKALTIAPDFTLALNNLGNLLVELGRYDEAEENYLRALKIRDSDEYAWYNLARLAELKNETSVAIERYRKAMENNPSNSHIPNNLGLLYARMGQYEDAEYWYKRSLEIDQENPLPWNNLGQIAEAKNDFETASTYYKKALELQPAFLVALNNLVNTLTHLGRSEEAEEWFKKALDDEPDNGDIHNSYGYFLLQRNELDRARDELLRAIECIPEFPLAFNNLGNVEFQRGHYDLAEHYYKKALEIHPTDLYADVNLGRCYLALSEKQKALSHFQAMKSKHPKNTALITEAANLLVNSGIVDEGIAFYEYVLTVDPNNAPARFNLANVLVRIKNDVKGALAHLELLHQQVPEFPGLKDKLAEVQGRR